MQGRLAADAPPLDRRPTPPGIPDVLDGIYRLCFSGLMKWKLAAVLWLAATAMNAQTPTVEERLLRLETEVQRLRAENDALRRELGLSKPEQQPQSAAASPTPTPAPSPAPDKPAAAPPRIGGFLQVQGESGDQIDSRFSDDNSRFYLRRARLNASGRLFEDFDYRLEADLAGSLSNSSGMRASMTDGYVTWMRFPGAKVRAGQFKSPFGYEQLYSDTRMMTSERALVSDRLSPGRQIGAQLFGDIFSKRLTYTLGVFNGTGTNTNFNDNDDFLGVARISAVLFQNDGAHWNAAVNAFDTTDTSLSLPTEFGFDSTPGSPAADNLFSGDRTSWGLDTQLNFGRIDFWAEYLSTTYQPVNNVIAEEFDSRGWYALAAWFALPERLQLVGRYETFESNTSLDDSATDTWTLGGTWFFNRNVKLQLNYLISDRPGSDDSEQRFIARIQTEF